MKQQDIFCCNNNITEINQIVLDHLNPSTSSSMYQQEQYEDQLINSYDDLHFPHPFLDDDDLFLSHFLSQQQQQQQLFEQEEKQDHEVDETTRKMKTKTKKKKVSGGNSNRKNGRSCTKRRGKKDRHSKIYTAQGPRDRRMRLSLQIARKFFDLQDMLGFDKASQTIEWLLLNSNSAIKDLKQTYFSNNSGVSHGSVYSGQSSEVVSEINNQDQEQEEAGGFTGSFKDKKGRQLRTVGREARDRARARARQRTLLKNTSFLQPPINLDHHLSGNNNNNNNTYLDYPTFSCPNSIFLPSPLSLPYSFSDSTLLKLP